MKSTASPDMHAAEDGAPEADGMGLSGAPSTHWVRYVPHAQKARITRMLNAGWEVKPMQCRAHGAWSVLMVWPSVYPPPEED